MKSATKKDRGSLRGKKVLITAGPTWVALDSVRVISNMATGDTGLLLASELIRRRAQVTLLLGPAGKTVKLPRPSKVIQFRFFDELEGHLEDELSIGGYDAVIHSAAVSDYQPHASYRWKVSSGMNKWNLLLKPTPKLIDSLARLAPHAYLVGFKFEPMLPQAKLMEKARRLMDHARLDAVIANTIRGIKYRAYVVSQTTRTRGPFTDKQKLAKEIVSLLGENL